MVLYDMASVEAALRQKIRQSETLRVGAVVLCRQICITYSNLSLFFFLLLFLISYYWFVNIKVLTSFDGGYIHFIYHYTICI